MNLEKEIGESEVNESCFVFENCKTKEDVKRKCAEKNRNTLALSFQPFPEIRIRRGGLF